MSGTGTRFIASWFREREIHDRSMVLLTIGFKFTLTAAPGLNPCRSRKGDDLVLVLFQTRQLHLRLFGIRAMHGRAIMAKSLLGEALWIPAGFGPLCPGVAV